MSVRKTKLLRRDRPRLEALAAEGLSRRAIAARLGMTRTDFAKALKADPQAQLRIEAGEAAHEMHLYNGLLAIAEKHRGNPAAVTPLLFALKTRAGYDDRPKPDTREGHIQNIVILPPAQSEAAYRRQLAAAREEITAEVVEEAPKNGD